MTFYRRKLPHLHAPGSPLFLTWRLHGSLPEGRAFPVDLTSGQAFVAMDRLLDQARTGPLHMERAEMAEIVAAAIERSTKMYELHAWVVMSNHVHLLITPKIDPSKITHCLKGSTAREANKILGVQGTFWQDESYDRLVRNAPEFERIKRYIEWNPVRAEMVTAPEEFLWSSAARR
jgi:putative transposase